MILRGRQGVGQGLDFDGHVLIADVNAGRNENGDRGEIQNGLDAGLNEPIHDFLRGTGGNGDHRDPDRTGTGGSGMGEILFR